MAITPLTEHPPKQAFIDTLWRGADTDNREKRLRALEQLRRYAEIGWLTKALDGKGGRSAEPVARMMYLADNK